jgi:hypothetical protein
MQTSAAQNPIWNYVFVVKGYLVSVSSTNKTASTFNDVSDEPLNRKPDDAAVISNCRSVVGNQHGEVVCSVIACESAKQQNSAIRAGGVSGRPLVAA